MKKAYTEKRFRRDSLDLIEILNSVIDEYLNAGYVLTLRQLYYQMIARDFLPGFWIDEEYNRKNGLPRDTKNTQRNYKKLGELVNDARMAGYIDWDAIEDRGRNLNRNPAWRTPIDILYSAWTGYHIDLWEGQAYRVEVWIEKESLIGVIEETCQRFDVPYYTTKGYNSQSEAKSAGDRLLRYLDFDQTPIIIHMGDHDPSGLDMTRDNRERLSLFTGEPITVHRLALNHDQILQYNPPPNPAKTTDARYTGYQAVYGDDSWELDALDPVTLNTLLEDAILKFRDETVWNGRLAQLNREKWQLEQLYRGWGDISKNLPPYVGD